MADAKHTSGPWMAVEIGQGGPWDNPVPVCEILTADGGSRICEYVTEANARLIASAPDLLEACRAILAWEAAEQNAKPFDDDGGAGFYLRIAMCQDAFDAARAAIAKATPQP